jgi:molybdopterin molybdotransferase
MYQLEEIMIQYADALRAILSIASSRHPGQTENVALDDSLDRVAAENIVSEVRVPSHPNSAMDGFAVRSKETRGASRKSPLRIRVLGSIAAGDVTPEKSNQTGAWEIMTGGPFPEGFDAAIKIEDVKIVSRNAQGTPTEIEITEEAGFEQNFREAGEDFDIGTPVLARGQIIQPEHLMALSAISKSKIPVLKRPRVAILATGKELAALGAELKPGQIRNSTRHYLTASAKKWGADVSFHGMTGDNPKDFIGMIDQILKHQPDVIVTTGAVSMGKHDFVSSALKELGAETVFHKVAIRPGKPILFAKFESGPVVFGLPGNPVATVVGWRFFIEPYLRELMGLKAEAPLRAKLPEQPDSPEGLRCFYKARLGENSNEVEVLSGQMSFMVSPLLDANVWAVIPEQTIGKDLTIDVYPLQSHIGSYS